MPVSALPITPLNIFEMHIEGSWTPSFWEDTTREFNPDRNPIVDQLLLIRYALCREHLRLTGEYDRLFWAHMNPADQLRAQAKAELYSELYKDVFALEMWEATGGADFAAASQWLDSHILNSPTLAKDFHAFRVATTQYDRMKTDAYASESNHYTPADIDYARRNISLAFSLLSCDLPYVTKWQNRVLDIAKPLDPSSRVDSDIRLLSAFPSDSQRDMGHDWAWHFGPLQYDMFLSGIALTHDLYLAKSASNRLTGQAMRAGKALLVDDAIPLPHLASFLAWYGVAGWGLRRLDQEEADRLHITLHDMNPTYVMHVCPPMMPRTKEHRMTSLIQDDTSHADHSLPARSLGHRRINGTSMIDYGYGGLFTIAFSATTSRIIAYNTSPNALAHPWSATDMRHLAIYGLRSYTDTAITTRNNPSPARLNPFLPNHALYATHRIPFKLLNDPWQYGRALGFGEDRVPDFYYRAYSKELSCHFRIDSASFLDSWIDAFVAAAQAWVFGSPADVSRAQMQAALRIQNFERNPRATTHNDSPESKSTKKRKPTVHVRFDDDWLN
jgi:hypothetical protein